MIVLPHNVKFNEDGMLTVELGVIRKYIPKSENRAIVRVKSGNEIHWCEAVIGSMFTYLDKLVAGAPLRCAELHSKEIGNECEHEQIDAELESSMNTSA